MAGGLAVATGLDPTLVRLAIVLGSLTGWGVLVYLIAWAVIPEEDPAKGRYLVPAPEQTARYIRIGLAVVGVLGVLHVIGTILGILSSAIIGIGLFPAHLFGVGRDRGFEGGEALLGLFLLVGGCVLLFRRHLPWTPAADTGAGGWGGSPSGGAGGPGGSGGWWGGPPSGGAGGPGGSGGWWGGPPSGGPGAPGGYGEPSTTGGTDATSSLGVTGRYGGFGGSGESGGSDATSESRDSDATGGSGGFGAGGAGSAAPGAGMAPATIAPGGGGGGATAAGYGAGGGYSNGGYSNGGYGPPPSSGSGGAGPGGFGARASAAARAARTNGPLLLVRATGWLAGLWFLAAAIVGGALWITGALRVRFPALTIVAVLAALGVLGYTLLRSRRVAAVVAAMALLLMPTALAAGVTRVDGQAGDRSITPRVPSDLEREYRHAIGALSLDLSGLQLPAGQTPLEVTMGAGKIEITVPWDAEVEARASIGAGSFDLFGSRQTGVNLDGKSRSGGQPGAPALVITAKAGAGEIIVRRGYEPFTHQAERTGHPVPLSCYPSGAIPSTTGVAATMHCSAADGVTKIPALACVVADSGSALCRPVGEPEPAVDFANEPGARRCQVPAGGGVSTCTAPIPGSRRSPAQGRGSFTCTIPEGGGESICRPGPGSGSGEPPPTPPVTTAPQAQNGSSNSPPPPPADPGDPAPTTRSGPPAAPGEYRCTITEEGGPATCEPM